jgi:hypothetical protein
MNRTYYISLLLLTVVLLPLQAEWPENREHNFIISGVPQYLISNGLRVDLDIHHKGSPNWLILSPYYYVDNESVDPIYLGGSDDNFDLYSYDQMLGVGLGIARRTFLSGEPVSEGFYLSYGAHYKYFDIDGNNFTWVEYTGEDELPYQEMMDIEYKLYIHSIGAYATVGYQKQVMPSLYLDVFLGFGVKYSFHRSPEKVTTRYNRGLLDYGYTGTHVVAGIRIGVGL